MGKVTLSVTLLIVYPLLIYYASYSARTNYASKFTLLGIKSFHTTNLTLAALFPSSVDDLLST